MHRAKPLPSEADSLTSGDIRLPRAVAVPVCTRSVGCRAARTEGRRTRRRSNAPRWDGTIHASAVAAVLIDGVREVGLSGIEWVRVNGGQLNHAANPRYPTSSSMIISGVRRRRGPLRRVVRIWRRIRRHGLTVPPLAPDAERPVRVRLGGGRTGGGAQRAVVTGSRPRVVMRERLGGRVFIWRGQRRHR